MPRHAKAWKFKRPLSRTKKPLEPKICVNKDLQVLQYLTKEEEESIVSWFEFGDVM